MLYSKSYCNFRIPEFSRHVHAHVNTITYRNSAIEKSGFVTVLHAARFASDAKFQFKNNDIIPVVYYSLSIPGLTVDTILISPLSAWIFARTLSLSAPREHFNYFKPITSVSERKELYGFHCTKTGYVFHCEIVTLLSTDLLYLSFPLRVV